MLLSVNALLKNLSGNKEPIMEQLINAFYMTIELWVFAGLLLVAMLVESVVTNQKRKAAEYQIHIDREIDRLHK